MPPVLLVVVLVGLGCRGGKQKKPQERNAVGNLGGGRVPADPLFAVDGSLGRELELAPPMGAAQV